MTDRKVVPPDLREAVAKLKEAGFRVIDADRVRIASTSQSLDNMELLTYGADHGFMKHVYSAMGSSLGRYLMEAGAVPVIKEIGGVCQTQYRASVTVLVDDPQFDWPFPLKMNK